MLKKYRRRLAELRDLMGEFRRQKALFKGTLAEERATLKDLAQKADFRERQLADREVAISELARQKTQGFPWLAQAYEEFLHIQDRETERTLRTKVRPAPKAADTLKQMSKQRRLAEKKMKVLEYVLRYYEALFPWLSELRGEDVDDLLIAVLSEPTADDDKVEDPARHWLTQAEYANLSTTERYQLALDRYWKKKKRPWEIGRDYERYVGYLYEQAGFGGYYQGIIEGLEDLGRDLIASNGRNVQVVQCKHWSRDKEIHEKHINQLYGTVTAYRIDYSDKDVLGVFYTSTRLSERAKQFADKLGIKYIELSPLQPYPSIKCNVSRRDETKIYHLPFDQQYDRTLIEEERLETYVETVAEAESLGFRRAFRWRGEPAVTA